MKNKILPMYMVKQCAPRFVLTWKDGTYFPWVKGQYIYEAEGLDFYGPSLFTTHDYALACEVWWNFEDSHKLAIQSYPIGYTLINGVITKIREWEN